jgi:ketosteroid isomerase-like protein
LFSDFNRTKCGIKEKSLKSKEGEKRMKKLIMIVLLTIISAGSAVAQNNKTEQELLKFSADYTQAIVNRDVAFFERALADDYIFPIDGMSENKAATVAYYKQEKANPTVKLILLKQEDVKTKVIGDTAILTGKRITTTGSIKDDNLVTHMDNGRYTLVLEKRRGNWMVVTEHNSEAPHNRQAMEEEVLKLGLEYAKMIKNQDAQGIERILADEYLYTDERGRIKNKAEDLATYKNDKRTYELVEISDQKVRIIGNSTAIETGTCHYKGIDNGKTFEGTERYTTTWILHNGRWQIIADHVSLVK